MTLRKPHILPGLALLLIEDDSLIYLAGEARGKKHAKYPDAVAYDIGDNESRVLLGHARLYFNNGDCSKLKYSILLSRTLEHCGIYLIPHTVIWFGLDELHRKYIRDNGV